MLLFLTLVLVGPYLVLTVLGRLAPRLRLARATRGKVGLSLLFLVTGSGHFLSAGAMAEMLPPFVPARLAIIYVTGVLELLGAIGIWVPRLERLTGFCLIALLVGVLPSNVYAALARVEYGGHASGPLYLLVRVPFQALVIAWAYRATRQRWLSLAGAAPSIPPPSPNRVSGRYVRRPGGRPAGRP